MKKLILLLGFIPMMVSAQLHQQSSAVSADGYPQLQQMESRIASAIFADQMVFTGDVKQAEQVRQWVKNDHAELQQPNTDIVLFYQTTSKLGFHYTFQQTYQGIPIYKANLVISLNATGVTLSRFNLLVSTEGWSSEHFTVQTERGKPMWIVSGKTPIAAYQKVDGEIIRITDVNGSTISTKEGAYHYEDTLVSGKVFLPDPLTSQQVVYGQGGTYKHFNDSDYALLNDQRKDVLFPATYANGVFRLENQYVKMVDLMEPWGDPVTSNTPLFDYTRSQDGFKETMVMYHLYATQLYYQYLGFNELKNYQIKVDAHSSTSDNSSFNFPSDSSLNFGTGGIPDAEDGDVPCHEYTHALSWFINPSLNMNTERRAIEEAMCDVISANFSKQYNGFNWRLIYNFDAPNPIASGLTKFWVGRDGNSAKTYQNYTGSPYADAEIWLSTMLDIAEAIGNDTAALLMLNTIYSMPENCTMPQAAILYMQADSILMQQSFGWKIGPIFNARKLGNFTTALSEQAKVLRHITVRNSAGFAMGQGNAMVSLPFSVRFWITDMQGRQVQHESSTGEIQLNPNDFAPGMYILTIQATEGQTSIKIIR
jgi:Zn-dependent metalloprotease